MGIWIFLIFAWSIVFLWCAAWWWTSYCLWRQKPLSLINEKAGDEPCVSVLVPARNEAHRILRENLDSILAQNYENFELIVLNDRSTDETKKIVEKLFAKQKKIDGAGCRIIDGIEPDETWLGKPHALQQAFKRSKGEWILTTDADIIFSPNALRTAISHAQTLNADALTLIPKTEFVSFWEKVFLPTFGWFCLLAMPVHRVNDEKRPESMGVGNFFLIKREVLEKLRGFECVKNEVAEDLKLAEILKQQGFRLRIEYAPDLIRTRMYSSFSEIWEGFSKNLFAGSKFSLKNVIFGAGSILLFGVLPPFLALIFLFIWLFSSEFWLFWLMIPFLSVYFLQIAVFVKLNRDWHGDLEYALFAPLGLGLFFAILLNSTYRVLSGKGVKWKGRAIYSRKPNLPSS